jgi:4-hydroxyacetophenone monooxygenase
MSSKADHGEIVVLTGNRSEQGGFPASMLVSNREALKHALGEADPATLLLVLVQLTGERRWLRDAKPYLSGPMSYQEAMPDAMRESIRNSLYDTLLDYAAHDRPWPPLPHGDLLVEMLSTAAGTEVGSDYAEMMREDLDPDYSPPRELGRRSEGAATLPAALDTVIIGAGMSGIAAAIYFSEAGIPFTIIEKDAAFGGTWYKNVYPGCGVDTPNHFYSYSFEPEHEWSHFFAKRDELWQYFESVADRYQLRNNTRFGTEVTSAVFDEGSARWMLELVGPDGVPTSLSARIVVSAVGVLSRPKWPEIEGMDTFHGTMVHSGAWDTEFDWRGKNVAVVGTGASAHQIIPTIAPDVDQLTVYQRSPHWVVPNPNYFREVAPGKDWALKHIPYYARWYRFQLFWGFADGLHEALKVDPDWIGEGRSINAMNDRHRKFMERFIRSELGEDSPLLSKVIPDYPPYAKRILIDNRWYRTLARENVELVTDPIQRVVPEGIETVDGTVRSFDAIIFATGFQASKMLAPMKIVGKGGKNLHNFWKPDDATAYLGTMVQDFPNFFTLLGPNTGLAHGGNAIFVTECQMRFVMKCLRVLIDEGKDIVEVTPEAQDRHVAEVDALHSGMVWSHAGANSWYRNPAGRVFAVLPYRLVDFWRMTRRIDRTEVTFA